MCARARTCNSMPQDVLPLPAAWAAGPRRKAAAAAAPPPSKSEHPPCFLNERDFRERVKALIDGLAEQERDREELNVWQLEWEEETLSSSASNGL